MSSIATEPRNARAIALMLLGTLLLTAMFAMAKLLGDAYHVLQIVFFRSLFALLPMLVPLYREGPGRLRTRRPAAHALRSVVGIASLALYFLSYQHMPLADAYAIGFAAPLFITALSVPMLAEKVGLRRWSAVLVGFVGVLIMVRPGSAVFDAVALLPLAAALLYAFVAILIRKLSRTEASVTIVIYYATTTVLVTGLALPLVWVTPDAADLALLAGIGVLGGCGQLAITEAFRHGELSVVAPFDYSSMVWAVLLGWWLWGDLPSLWIWAGMPLVVASGIYIARREIALERAGGR